MLGIDGGVIIIIGNDRMQNPVNIFINLHKIRIINKGEISSCGYNKNKQMVKKTNSPFGNFNW